MSSAKSSQITLRECFHEFSDPRREHLRLHSLWDIIGLTLCAMICGCDSVVEIHEYGVKKFDFLCTFLDLENGVPSHDTIGRVFAMLQPEKFRDCFARWTQSLAQSLPGRVIAIDGKTLRGVYDIHQASGRSLGPYHAVNCAAIPGQLLESQLFGHRVGAFTGAYRAFKGLFEQADKGTLFLDEVGECDPAMQAKLLRVLQPPAEELCLRVFSPLGSEDDVRSNVRIIAATNRDLLDMVSKGTFREDLYYRLASVTLRLPTLRERQSDVPDIAKKLLQQIGKTLVGKDAMRLSPDALR